jgi:hypothetical protein
MHRFGADDFTVIWRVLPIGRVMLAPGLPQHRPAMAPDLQLQWQAWWRW